MLRVAVAISTLMLTDASTSFVAYGLGFLVAISLCAGVLTRAIAGLSVVTCAVAFAASASLETTVAPGLAAVALALTGPGAFSVDARLFGRRTITLPNPDDTIV